MTINKEVLGSSKAAVSENNRVEEAYYKRIEAANIARNRKYMKYDSASKKYMAIDPSEEAIEHISNGDEDIRLKPMSFTKGLPHDYENGLLTNEDHFDDFVTGIDSGKPEDFKMTRLGPDTAWRTASGNEKIEVRAWESAGAGLTFDLQGPDAQSVTMPPAPKLGSDELTAEIAEVYAQALLRDIPFSEYYAESQKCNAKVDNIIEKLNYLSYFQGLNRNGSTLTRENVFRGITNSEKDGPYLSQFLLAGNSGLGGEWKSSYGKIGYGSITIDQRVRYASPINYLTDWDSWYDAQNGANFGGREKYENNQRRFITTPRDMATYVHYDALYEAYLNACILLLSFKVSDETKMKNLLFDEGVPFREFDKIDHQQGFAHYGGPHILTLVTEVATRALKAVRFQKFNTHRRLRPEALAARFEKLTEVKYKLNETGNQAAKEAAECFQQMYDALNADGNGIFNMLRQENEHNLLLPMAFAEGSPMHPSYGAGHATVAGACVTILKAFFNHKLFIEISENGDSCKLTNQEPSQSYAYIPDESGYFLKTYKTKALTLEGELNKLAANISIGRDWAGVHYYSDYERSLYLGEEIAIGLLEEQAIMYNKAEGFYLTVPKFDGTTVKIDHTGVH